MRGQRRVPSGAERGVEMRLLPTCGENVARRSSRQPLAVGLAQRLARDMAPGPLRERLIECRHMLLRNPIYMTVCLDVQLSSYEVVRVRGERLPICRRATMIEAFGQIWLTGYLRDRKGTSSGRRTANDCERR